MLCMFQCAIEQMLNLKDGGVIIVRFLRSTLTCMVFMGHMLGFAQPKHTVVDFYKLVDNPEFFNGKFVTVRGYLHVELGHDLGVIYLSSKGNEGPGRSDRHILVSLKGTKVTRDAFKSGRVEISAKAVDVRSADGGHSSVLTEIQTLKELPEDEAPLNGTCR